MSIPLSGKNLRDWTYNWLFGNFIHLISWFSHIKNWNCFWFNNQPIRKIKFPWKWIAFRCMYAAPLKFYSTATTAFIQKLKYAEILYKLHSLPFALSKFFIAAFHIIVCFSKLFLFLWKIEKIQSSLKITQTDCMIKA